MNLTKLEQLAPEIIEALEGTGMNRFCLLASRIREAMAEQPDARVVPINHPTYGALRNLVKGIEDQMMNGQWPRTGQIGALYWFANQIAAPPNNVAATQERNLNSSHSEAGGASDGLLPDSPAPAAAPELPLTHEQIVDVVYVYDRLTPGTWNADRENLKHLGNQALAAIDLKRRLAEMTTQRNSYKINATVFKEQLARYKAAEAELPEEPALSESIDDPDGCGDVVAREDYNDLRTFAIAQVAALAALKVEKDGHKANYLYELDLRVRAEAERNAAMKERDQLLVLSTNLAEHPDDYDGPCMCQSCMSYADDDNAAIAEGEKRD